MNSRTTLVAAVTTVAGLGSLSLFTATPAEAQNPAKPATDVQVVNTPTVHVATLPEVRVLNEKEPVRIPFLFFFNGENSGVSMPEPHRYTVPEGKVLVIEAMSINSPVTSLYSISIDDHSGDSYQFAAFIRPPEPTAFGIVVGNQLVPLRLQAGHSLGMTAYRSEGTGATAVQGVFNGYLEPAPPATD
jgi:hypothetical protein